MAKYNPQNTKHRAWLSQNILSTLAKWNFKIMPMEKAWEFVAVRETKFGNRIVVYTSIDKRSGAMRDYATDRIRIVVAKRHKSPVKMPTTPEQAKVFDDADEFMWIRVARINRTGEFKAITSRLCEGIIAAQEKLAFGWRK
tara:strand:+ start:306 stop:728 length:423 start_codon:yes stop_codon:yes gene_type:complete